MPAPESLHDTIPTQQVVSHIEGNELGRYLPPDIVEFSLDSRNKRLSNDIVIDAERPLLKGVVLNEDGVHSEVDVLARVRCGDNGETKDIFIQRQKGKVSLGIGHLSLSEQGELQVIRSNDEPTTRRSKRRGLKIIDFATKDFSFKLYRDKDRSVSAITMYSDEDTTIMYSKPSEGSKEKLEECFNREYVPKSRDYSKIKKALARVGLASLALTANNGPVNEIFDVFHTPDKKVEQVMDDMLRWNPDQSVEEQTSASPDYPLSSYERDQKFVDDMKELMQTRDNGENEIIHEQAQEYRQAVVDAGGFNETDIKQLQEAINTATSQSELITVTKRFFETYGVELQFDLREGDAPPKTTPLVGEIGNSREVVSAFIDFASIFPPNFFDSEFKINRLVPVKSQSYGLVGGVANLSSNTIFISTEGLFPLLSNTKESVIHESQHTRHGRYSPIESSNSLVKTALLSPSSWVGLDTQTSYYGAMDDNEQAPEILRNLFKEGPPNPDYAFGFEHSPLQRDMLSMMFGIEHEMRTSSGPEGFSAFMVSQQIDKGYDIIPFPISFSALNDSDFQRLLIAGLLFKRAFPDGIKGDKRRKSIK